MSALKKDYITSYIEKIDLPEISFGKTIYNATTHITNFSTDLDLKIEGLQTSVPLEESVLDYKYEQHHLQRWLNQIHESVSLKKETSKQRFLNFHSLKNSEGQVISIDFENHDVLIKFHEIGSKDDVVEEVVFDFAEISESDMDLLKEGAIVYWNIGYLEEISGTRSRISELKFRRMPAWSKNDVVKVNKKAAEFKKFFNNSND